MKNQQAVQNGVVVWLVDGVLQKKTLIVVDIGQLKRNMDWIRKLLMVIGWHSMENAISVRKI